MAQHSKDVKYTHLEQQVTELQRAIIAQTELIAVLTKSLLQPTKASQTPKEEEVGELITSPIALPPWTEEDTPDNYVLSSQMDPETLSERYGVPVFGAYKGEEHLIEGTCNTVVVWIGDRETREEAAHNLPIRLADLDTAYPTPWSVRSVGVRDIGFGPYAVYNVVDSNGEGVVERCEVKSDAEYIARMVNRAVKSAGKRLRGSKLRERPDFLHGSIRYGRRNMFGIIACPLCADSRYAGEPVSDEVARAIVDCCLVF